MSPHPPPIDRPRRTIGERVVLGIAPVAGAVAAYVAARSAGAWAAGLVSGVGALAISLAWSRRASRLDEALSAFAELSRTDDLTGLGNDRAFRDRLTRFAREATRGPLSLILFDVDDFKSYNDTFGHPAGDEALKSLGAILGATIPESILKHRLGGDEFALLLVGTDRESAMIVAERIRAAVSAYPWPLRPITSSFGVASAVGEEVDPADLLSRADRALYRSKDQGRNRVSD